MSQLGEAVSRYHKILESEPAKDLSWAQRLRQQMMAAHLTIGMRPACLVLRPNFISRRQYTNLVKAAEHLASAIARMKSLALSTPALLNRMAMLPAEKMLASIDPKYSSWVVASQLDTNLNNGSLHFLDYAAETPLGVAYGDALADLFLETPPMKEFRKKHAVVRVGGANHLVQALLKAYKEFGGKKQPNIAIVEFRQPHSATDNSENLLLREYLRRHGHRAEIVTPDQLEYRNNILRRGDFTIDLVYRRVKVHEFLVRFDLTHPLVRAYREGSVCVVNSFRSEIAQKKAFFDLLTDGTVTANFPAAEKKAIREFIPWTRVVAQTKTSYEDRTIDLLDHIQKHREKLVLKPNDDSGDLHAVRGWETDDAGWERALRTALRNPYVVQERVEPVRATFPLFNYGVLEYREMHVDVHPHVFLGKVSGCTSWVSTGAPGFSSVSGLAPTFILESK